MRLLTVIRNRLKEEEELWIKSCIIQFDYTVTLEKPSKCSPTTNIYNPGFASLPTLSPWLMESMSYFGIPKTEKMTVPLAAR
jgi:hypothetical protein